MLFLSNCYLQARQYQPAVLKKIPSRGWLIEYYLLDLETNVLKRKAIGLNAMAKRFGLQRAQFKTYANTLVAQINIQLSNGVYSFNNATVERVHDQINARSKNERKANYHDGCSRKRG